MLILSLFPGIDLLGRGFEAEGFTIVRGPDLLWGGDIRGFHVPPNRFDGIIAGSPCPDFSVARRSAPTGEGVEMLGEFIRVVVEAQPDWFLLENVPAVPDVKVEGYSVQRFDLRATECGGQQWRLRHFQFGSRRGLVIQPERQKQPTGKAQRTCMATEGSKPNRRTWADFCELQGLPRDFDLPGYSREAKYRAVGNGVPVMMARTIAKAIRESATATEVRTFTDVRLCACNCGRVVTGKQISAGPTCRKRLQKARQAPRRIVTALGMFKPGDSQFSVNRQAS